MGCWERSLQARRNQSLLFSLGCCREQECQAQNRAEKNMTPHNLRTWWRKYILKRRKVIPTIFLEWTLIVFQTMLKKLMNCRAMVLWLQWCSLANVEDGFSCVAIQGSLKEWRGAFGDRIKQMSGVICLVMLQIYVIIDLIIKHFFNFF